MKRERALSICGISKNQYYYRPRGSGKRGRKPSKVVAVNTAWGHETVKNVVVVEWIKKRLSDPLNTEGYHRMTGALQLAGFYINHKKVYRLMKNNQLLRRPAPRQGKQYVKYRILAPEGPLRLMEVDIKVIWVAGKRKYAYNLTILDVFTRVVLYHATDWRMTQQAVQKAWADVIETYLEPEAVHGWELHIEVRSDNGPQFCAKKLQVFLATNYLMQTFTHPYTPQENGHIESFHAILDDYVQSKGFNDLEELQTSLSTFYSHYNEYRIHGSTLNMPPILFWNQWKQGNIERIVLDEKMRKVKFKLKVARQTILIQIDSAGNRSQEGGLLPDFEGSIPEKSESSIKLKQTDGAVLNARPAV